PVAFSERNNSYFRRYRLEKRKTGTCSASMMPHFQKISVKKRTILFKDSVLLIFSGIARKEKFGFTINNIQDHGVFIRISVINVTIGTHHQKKHGWINI